MAGLDWRRARDQREPVWHRRVEPGIALRRGYHIAARAGVLAWAIGIRSGCSAGLGDRAKHEYGLRSGRESICVQMDYDDAEKSEAVFRDRGRDAVHQYEGARGDFARELHDERGVGRTHPGRETQLDGGSAVHAHLERGDFQSKSGDQYDSSADWVGNVSEIRKKLHVPPVTKKTGRASQPAPFSVCRLPLPNH